MSNILTKGSAVTSSEKDIQETVKSIFGNRLKFARRRALLTLQELSSNSKVASSTIGKWEAGLIKEPQPKAVNAVAIALGLNPGEVFDWLEETQEALRQLPQVSPSKQEPIQEIAANNDQTHPPFRFFGTMLAGTRRRAGMTLRDLAEKVGTSPQKLSSWEIGNVRNPHPQMMRRVAVALGIDPVEKIFEWQEKNEQLLAEEALEKSIGSFNEGQRTFNGKDQQEFGI